MTCVVCREVSRLILEPVTRIEFDAVVARFGIPPVQICGRCFRFLAEMESSLSSGEN
jgi:hypothetical protein